MDPTMNGICRTDADCTESGGEASGNSASGFGVCCFTTLTEDGEITNNLTYIQNVGFPAAVGNTAPVAALTNTYTVKGGGNICQIKFDFDTAVLADPTTNGACPTGEAISVTSTSTTMIGVESLCGTLTGSHLHINNDGADPAGTIEIT